MLSLWLALLGCSGPAPQGVFSDSGHTEPAVDTGDPYEDDLDSSCAVVVEGLWPMDGAKDITPEPTVTAQLSAPVPDDAAAVIDVDGAVGTTELSEDRTTLTWTPSQPLDRATTYLVHTDLCGQLVTTRFTTLPDSVPLESWNQRAWTIETDAIEVVTPAVLEALLTTSDAIVIQTTPGEPAPKASLQAGSATRDGYRTDCTVTVDAGPMDITENPRVQVGPVDLEVGIATQTMALRNLVLSAIVTPQGETLRSLRLSATVDTRTVVEMTGLCDLSAGLGEPCIPCYDGQPACMPIVLRADEAPQTELLNTCGE